MLTIHFAGRELGERAALSTSQEGEVARWRATLEFSAETQELVAQAVSALEAKLSGEGTLEVRHGSTALRTLSAQNCAQGPWLARRQFAEGDDAEAHPLRSVTLDFEALLAVAPAVEPPAVAPRLSESVSTSVKRHVVDLPLLAPNSPPWRQEIGGPAFEVLQEGEAAAADYVDAHAPAFPFDVIERRVSYVRESGLCVTRWRYLMRPLAFAKAVKP
jgi:hypothetical protein